ncbi:MAG: hypothetical protein KZQ77_09755, partial [Candidatus Thiodiazotropha sp. (ex Notomyrtea botanica)]|nr:hypothetical protein [Candidatus Thiodiazotropha sp. (ex Notomyrtea botanica)]
MKDNAQALGVDSAGNLYVTGFSDAGDGNYDYATIKYDSEGNELWVVHYDGKSHSVDWVRDLAIDNKDNVIVSGSSTGEGTGLDFLTVKYDAKGKQLWANRYDGPGHRNDRVKALAVDTAGNVYVAGNISDERGCDDAVTIKYGASGDLLWETPSNSQCNTRSLSSVAVDLDGNVYAVGKAERELDNTDFIIIKYDSMGKELWTQYHDWSANDDARFLSLDATGNIYVTGASLRYTEGAGRIGHEDIATVKYDPSGRELWTASYNGGSGLNDVASSLRVDDEGYVYISGTTYSSIAESTLRSNADIITIKYNQDGDQMWSAAYGGPGETYDIAKAMALDASGGVYVLGSERDSVERKSWLVTVKYGPDGQGQWVAREDGVATGRDESLAVDNAGNVWAIGSDVT